jgi:hypothetical protein
MAATSRQLLIGVDAMEWTLACGPGVPAGVEVTGHSTLDAGPTVLRQAGVRTPETMDGVPIVSGS